jgi:hypothetical protein
MSQGNSLCSSLKQAKMSLFSFSFFLYRIRDQEDGTGLVWEEVGTGGRGEEVGKW